MINLYKLKQQNLNSCLFKLFVTDFEFGNYKCCDEMHELIDANMIDANMIHATLPKNKALISCVEQYDLIKTYNSFDELYDEIKNDYPEYCI